MSEKMEVALHPNIHIFTPESNADKFTLDNLTESILKKVVGEKISEKNV